MTVLKDNKANSASQVELDLGLFKILAKARFGLSIAIICVKFKTNYDPETFCYSCQQDNTVVVWIPAVILFWGHQRPPYLSAKIHVNET